MKFLVGFVMAAGLVEVTISKPMREQFVLGLKSSSPVRRQLIAIAELDGGSPTAAEFGGTNQQDSPAPGTSTRAKVASSRSPLSPYLVRALPPVEIIRTPTAAKPAPRQVAPQRPTAPQPSAPRQIAPQPVANVAKPAIKSATPAARPVAQPAPIAPRHAAPSTAGLTDGLDDLAYWLGTQSDASITEFVRNNGAHHARNYVGASATANDIALSADEFHAAIAAYVARHSRSHIALTSDAESQLRAQVDEALAGVGGLFEQFRPNAKRAVPALLATSVVTAALMMSGMHGDFVGADIAAASNRGMDATASRNNIEAGNTQAQTPTTVAAPVAPAAPPAAAPPTTAAPAPAPKPAPDFVNPTPTARLTSNYGGRINPVTHRFAPHEGVDFAAPTGTPIAAATSGTVTKAGWTAGYGNYTCIAKDNSNISTCYGHQSKIAVRVGQHVTAGQIIGNVGNTGNSTGSHLHFEVRIAGKAVNPLPYI